MSALETAENPTDERGEAKSNIPAAPAVDAAPDSKQEPAGEGVGETIASAGHVQEVADGGELEAKSEESQIHTFAQAGDVEGVRRCLMNGYNVNEVDELGCTPVHLAGAMGHTNVVKLLVEDHGAAVDARDGALCTSLHAASEGGHPVMVALLLRLGAQINARNRKQQTPLHYACGYGQADAAFQLAVHGASADARDVQGNTPLHLACSGGGEGVVRLLISQGSELDALNTRGRRPLHLACRAGNVDIVYTLLENGADPSVRDANGMMAADMIGAKRPIASGVRLELLNILERYYYGDYAMARPEMRPPGVDEGMPAGAGVPAERDLAASVNRGDVVGTQWELGAAVAGRLEEMRARELGASLRAKVQENEAMRRYLDSVKEEMRVLQQKLSRQAVLQPSSSSSLLADAGMTATTSGGGTGGYGVFEFAGSDVRSGSSAPPTSATFTNDRSSAAFLETRQGSTTEGSIAERVAQGMYGAQGLERLGLQRPSGQQQESTASVQQEQHHTTSADAKMWGGAPGRGASARDAAAAAISAGATGVGPPAVKGGAGGTYPSSAGASAEEASAGIGGTGGVEGGAESGGGMVRPGVAPIDASFSGGGSSAEQPVVGPAAVSMSQMLMKKKDQLQSLLDNKPSRAPA